MMLTMKINTKKIIDELERTGTSLAELGMKMDPPASKWAVWHTIHNAKSFRPIEIIAKALNFDAKDLILS